MKTFRHFLHNLSEVFFDLSSRGGFVACVVILVISLFLVELPTWLLDVLLVINLFVALTLLLRGLFIDNALRIFSFPSILVLTTLFRLALNVSSTKLILLHGDQGLDAAGHVIQAFGESVVGGDFVVGAIVFAIIAVVNFVVIAKGSARVAEVSARFTLDALPGRQLSIDSELRAGNISRDEAAERRDSLTRESQFFGAMDGAMKWVQGDAIAGLAITFINAIGGISLGVYRGLPIGEAVDTFGVLTIGDGLVSILPSLLISVSAGIIVTHVSGKEKRDAGDEIFSQILSDFRAPLVASAALFLIALLGLVGLMEFPFFPFFLVAAAATVFFGSRTWVPRDHHVVADEGAVAVVEWGQTASERMVPRLLPSTGISSGGLKELGRSEGSIPGLDLLVIEVDSREIAQMLGLVDVNGEMRLGEGAEYLQVRIHSLQQEAFIQRGIHFPEIAFRVNQKLGTGCYRVLVRGQVARQGSLQSGFSFVGTTAGVLSVMGIKMAKSVRHPLDYRLSAWVDSRHPGLYALKHLDIEVIAPEEFLVLEAIGAAYQVIDEVFGLDEAKAMLAQLGERHGELIAEIFDAERLTYPEFAEILRRLLRERVNIRDLKLILEGIAEFSALHGDIEDRQEWLSELHSFLRVVMARSIVNDATGPGDRLRTFALSPDIENEFRSAISMWSPARTSLPFDPVFEKMLKNNAAQIFAPVLERGVLPIVVLCPADIRSAVQDFFGKQAGKSEWIRALAYQEVGEYCRPESIGVLSVQN